jgi:epoxyqueuosine reductase
LTIEHNGAIPHEFREAMGNRIYGCDDCLAVCPWNKFSKSHREPLFNPHPDLLSMTKKDWEEITEDVFKKVFQKSAVKRTKFSGLQRNIEFLK